MDTVLGEPTTTPTPMIVAMTVVEIARRVADAEQSPVEVLDEYLARLADTEPAVGAFVDVDADGARARARGLTEELVRNGPRSPLHGVPVGVKNLIDVEGFPTRAGSAVLADAPPAERDAAVVARLREAGAVVVGTTHTHEFAYGAITPATRHPHWPDRIVGGSSGGSAAAVASGAVAAALGTDTAGSARLPPALCGVAGLKPRRGVLPVDGVVPLSPLLDCVGLIAPTSADLQLIWSVLVGGASVRPTRIGIVADETLGPYDDAVRTAFESAAAVFAPVPVPLTPFARAGRARHVVVAREALEVHRARGWYPDHRYGRPMSALLETAARCTVDDVVRGVRELADQSDEVLRALDHHDALVLPTAPTVAPLRAGIDPDDPADAGRVIAETLRFTAAFNGCPVAALSVPVPVPPGCPPVGLQIVARDEMTAFAVAAMLPAV